MRRLAEVTGLVPVEFPATRRVGATPAERAADVNAAFADPGIRAILAVIGGDDQITVIQHGVVDVRISSRIKVSAGARARMTRLVAEDSRTSGGLIPVLIPCAVVSLPGGHHLVPPGRNPWRWFGVGPGVRGSHDV